MDWRTVTTVALFLAGYAIVGLVAWGKLTAKLDQIGKNQEKMPTNDAMRADLLKMQLEMTREFTAVLDKKLPRMLHRRSDDDAER